MGNGLGGFVANAADLQELLFGRLKNRGRFAEMFNELPHAHRTHPFDEIECNMCFAGVHEEERVAFFGLRQVSLEPRLAA
jgi:hypothetical protein